MTRAVVATISAATVWRVLHRDAIRPWFHRSWIFPRDPNFAAKAAVALDLYARIFSIVQRKVVNPNDFTDLDQIRDRLAAFEDRYNAMVEPFDWTFGRDDLVKFIARLDAHTAIAA